MRFTLIATSFLIITIPCLSQNIHFFKEDITFSIQGNNFEVSGTYYFRNDLPYDISRSIFYPFPTDSLYGTVDTLILYNPEYNCEIEYNKSKTGLQFKYKFKENSVSVFYIFYRQKLKGNRAEYILETTKNWGEPLETASYQLVLPPDKKLLSSTYEFNEELIFDERRIYLWNMENFMPLNNFVFIIKESEEKNSDLGK